jgi:hypothetical protein
MIHQSSLRRQTSFELLLGFLSNLSPPSRRFFSKTNALFVPSLLLLCSRCQTSAKCKADWTTYPTMHLNYLSEGGAIAWTLVCLVPLALDEVLRVRANGKK